LEEELEEELAGHHPAKGESLMGDQCDRVRKIVFVDGGIL
jgi:hypothetical protein